MWDETRVNRSHDCISAGCVIFQAFVLLIRPTTRPRETERLTVLVKLSISDTVKYKRWDGTICHSRCRIALRITQRKDKGDKKP